MPQSPAVHPVDQIPPLRKLLPFGLQHVLVMAAAPISSIFLVSKTLGLSSELTVQRLSVTFILSGVGPCCSHWDAGGSASGFPS
jgi:xanthine/uracil permease